MRSGFGVGKPCNQLLIDCEEDRTLRAVLVGMSRNLMAGARARLRGRRMASPHVLGFER
jgi:hypothetical protein